MTCRFCSKPAISYYDITLTGIGNFVEYCEDHEAEARKVYDKHEAYWKAQHEQANRHAMTEREAFEAWCRENGHPVGIRTDGSYVGSTETRFGAWQARAALADAERARVAKRCAEIVGSVDNYANPMTANDCVDAILAEFPEAK